MSRSQHPASDAAPARRSWAPQSQRGAGSAPTPAPSAGRFCPQTGQPVPCAHPNTLHPPGRWEAELACPPRLDPVSTVPGELVGPRGEWTLQHQDVVATSAHHHAQEPGQSGREAQSAQVTREEAAAQLKPGPRATQQPQDTRSHRPAQPSSYLPRRSRPWAQRPAP